MAGAGEIRAGRAFIEVSAKDKGLRAGLGRAAGMLKSFGASLLAVGASAAMSFATIGVAGVGALFAASKVYADAGANLLDMSQRTGISVEALSALGFAAEQSGADVESLDVGIKKMQDSLIQAANGNKTAQKALADLGLTAEELLALSPDEQFRRISEAITGVADPAQRTAIALDLFGKSGTKLLPTMMDLENQLRRHEELGLGWTTEEAKAAESFGDALGEVWAVLKRGVALIGGLVAPAFKLIANLLANGIGAVLRWTKQYQGLIDMMAAGDFSLAGQLALAALQLAWTTAWTFMANVFDTVVSGIRIVWVTLTGFLTAGMAEAARAVIGVFGQLGAGILDTIQAVMGQIRSLLQSAVDLKVPGAETLLEALTITQRAAGRFGENFRRGVLIADAALAHVGENALLQAGQRADQIREERDARIEARNAAVDEARANLARLDAEAKALKDSPFVGGILAGAGGAGAGAALARMPGEIDRQLGKLDVAGGFSAFGLGQMGFGKSIEQKQLDEQRKGNALLKQIADKDGAEFE